MNTHKIKILNSALQTFDDSGWSGGLLNRSCKDCGYDEEFYKIVFPNGAIDFIDFYLLSRLDEVCLFAKNDESFAVLKTHEKIELLLKNYLSTFNNEKYILKKTLNHLAMPHNLAHFAHLKWQIVDKIWQESGDKSIDFNYYTKRLTLYGVFGSLLFYFIKDDSENSCDSWQFLQRSLKNVAKIGKFKSSLFNKKL